MPWAESSTIWARRQVTTDPVPRRTMRSSRLPSSLLLGGPARGGPSRISCGEVRIRREKAGPLHRQLAAPAPRRTAQRFAAAALIWGWLCPVGRVRQPLWPSPEGLPLAVDVGGDERVDVDAWSLSYARIGAAGRVVRRERYRRV